MGHSPRESPNKTWSLIQADYAAESSLPCWPRVPLASAHINKLMIIAKGEEPHTKQPNKQHGKLEYKAVYHTVTCYFTIYAV